MPWRRAGQPTPGFLPGESRGERSLAGHSPPWGLTESDTPDTSTQDEDENVVSERGVWELEKGELSVGWGRRGRQLEGAHLRESLERL